jgi:hypothetical protein
MKLLRKFYISMLWLVLPVMLFAQSENIFAQSENKDVNIVASGSGGTLDDAKQAALRSATEQAFGAFISSKTEMFNDVVVADQMASVSSGNIKSYELLNQDQLPDGRWGVTLKAIVSVEKLTSFVQAKGITIEIKGGMFALNIKQQLLNEQGEIKAVAEMVGLLHEPMQTAFDYVIKSSDPKSVDAESKNWEIPLTVTATCNKNMDFCANYFIKTLTALSLTEAEVATYQSLNKQVFPVRVSYAGQPKTFHLRKQTSTMAINSLVSNWNFYTRLFAVLSGMDESYGNGEGRLHNFGDDDDNNFGDVEYINFLSAGSVAGTFTWNDERTLSQIEQMTGYSVKPLGVKSQFKHGGYVVQESNGHGLVAAVCDIGEMNWNDAITACQELVMNGYSDWVLPNKDQLELIHKNLHQKGIGGFSSEYYWSSSEYSARIAWCFDFGNGRAYNFNKDFAVQVRAVRAF